MKFFRSFFLLIAGAIVVLHNLTPHDHCNDVLKDKGLHTIAEPDDFMDPIRLAFHNDILGNLEQILPADDFQCDELAPVVLPFNISEIVQTESRLYFYPVRAEVEDYFFEYSCAEFLRGPPSC